jgi:hypothetical protein
LSSPAKLALYVATLCLASFELTVLWFALHPSVPATYRAYYIDRTTTCLAQPVLGTYGGGVVSFRDDGREQAKPLKVCGWEGPAGDGTHAVGTSARLRFAPISELDSAVLVLQLRAIDRDEVPGQTVGISVDGERLATVPVTSGNERTIEVPLGRGVEPGDPPLEVEFDLPNAVSMGPTDPSTRWRSIKLTAAGLLEGDEL